MEKIFIGSSQASYVTLGLAAFFMAKALYAAPRDIADRLCNRLNGVPPTAALLDAVTKQVESNQLNEAALSCINTQEGYFYNETLKSIFLKWQTPDSSSRIGISDFTTTLIGFVKEDIPFNTVLSADVVFISSLAGAPPYSLVKPTAPAAPDMFRALEASPAPLHASIQRAQQTTAAGTGSLPAEAVAGVLTTREFAASYFSAGTLRRATASVLKNFLCSDLESIHDTSIPDTFVRRDVTRSPGGDSSLYINRCKGCHAGMDALTSAFVYHDWDDTTTPAQPRLAYTAGSVRPKVNRNGSEFPEGFITMDNSWSFMWTDGPAATKIGWTGSLTGIGLKSLGEALGNTHAFAECMTRNAVEAMCIRKIESQDDLTALKNLTERFKKNSYNLKQTFAEAAVYCTKE